MAKIKLLVDMDIIIDYLKGITPAKKLFKSKNIEILRTIFHDDERLELIDGEIAETCNG
jgi:hypothetical protein